VLDTVPDPEMPAVSVVELGMVVDVRVAGGRAEVDLVPTFSGCPALALIHADVAAAVARLDGARAVAVRFVNDVIWTPERITEAGRRKLREFGIAPPGSGQQPHGLGGTALVRLGRRAPAGQTRCPFCGSTDTVVDSPFGPTPCRSTHYCPGCRNPFEAVKP
jgi:ring-1,2-phenylacetyl-CoA epoxidase subunit PaaD